MSLIWARRKDKVTKSLPEVEPLLDNEPLAEHYYQIIVYTGPITNAGTTSDVTLRLIGTEGTTEPHILKTKSGICFDHKHWVHFSTLGLECYSIF